MTLDQLRVFVAAAELEHVTRAAEALNVTQSAASAAIAALETRHGVPLFDRVGRGVRLTQAGRAFLDEARAVLAQAAHAEQALADFAGLRRGVLGLVASQTIASYWLPARLAAFKARHPQIEVRLLIDNTEGAARRVIEGEAELGFVEGEVDAPALSHRAVALDPMVLVAAQPVARVDDDWLMTTPWIVREQGSGTRSWFEAELRQRGLDADARHIALTLPSNEAVMTAVAAGAGVAVLPRAVAARALAAGDVAEAPLPLPDRPFHLLRHKERYRTKAADALIALFEAAAP